MNRNVAPANQKNREHAVEVEAVEETDESTDETEKEIDLTPGALSRIDDPVRLYLNEMAGVSLLTREGEIELAKRIEDGKYELTLAIAGMPMTLTYLDALRLAMKKGELRVRDLVLVNDATDEEELEEEYVEDEEDEGEFLRRILTDLEKLRRVGKSLLTLYAKRRKATQVQLPKITKQVHNAQQQIVEQLDALNLHPEVRDELLRRIKEKGLALRGAERVIQDCCRRIGKSRTETAKVIRRMGRERTVYRTIRRKIGCSDEALEKLMRVFKDSPVSYTHLTLPTILLV